MNQLLSIQNYKLISYNYNLLSYRKYTKKQAENIVKQIYFGMEQLFNTELSKIIYRQIIRTIQFKFEFYMKSSNYLDKKQEKLLCTCQLYIDTAKIPYEGFAYFLWQKDQVKAQTLKYQFHYQSQLIIKQTLTINIPIKFKNQMPSAVPTSLKLIDSRGDDVDQVILRVDLWKPEIQTSQISIGGGKAKIKTRRKQLMRVNEFQIRNSIQRNSKYILQNSMINLDRSIVIKSSLPELQTKKSDVMRQQFVKLQRQLQDAQYLCNKLKNDRTVLLAQVSQLQEYIFEIFEKARNDINNTTEFFNNKIALREKIYEQYILDLVASINEGNLMASNIIKTVSINQQKALKKSRDIQLKCQRKITTIETDFQMKMTQNQINMNNILKKQQIEKNKLTDKINDLETQIEELNNELKNQQLQLNQTKQLLFNAQSQLQEFKEQEVLQYTLNIKKLQDKLIQKQNQEMEKDKSISAFQNQLKENLSLIEKLKNQLNQSTRKCKEADDSRIKMKNQLQNNQKEAQNTLLQYKALQSDFITLNKRTQLKEKQFADKLRQLQENHRKKIQDSYEQNKKFNNFKAQLQQKQQQLQRQLKQQKQQLQDKLKQIEQLKSKISEFEKIQQAYNTLKIERDSLNDRIKQEINIKQQITQENQAIYKQLQQIKQKFQSIRILAERYQRQLEFVTKKITKNQTEYDDIKERFQSAVNVALMKFSPKKQKGLNHSNNNQSEDQDQNYNEAEKNTIKNLERQLTNTIKKHENQMKQLKFQSEKQINDLKVKLGREKQENQKLLVSIKNLQTGQIVQRVIKQASKQADNLREQISEQLNKSIQIIRAKEVERYAKENQELVLQLQKIKNQLKINQKEKKKLKDESIELESINVQLQNLQKQKKMLQTKAKQIHDKMLATEKQLRQRQKQLQKKIHQSNTYRDSLHSLEQSISLLQSKLQAAKSYIEDRQYTIKISQEQLNKYIEAIKLSDHKQQQQKNKIMQLMRKIEEIQRKNEEISFQLRGNQQRLLLKDLDQNRIKYDLDMKLSLAQNRAQQLERRQKIFNHQKNQLMEASQRQKKKLKNQVEFLSDKINKMKRQFSEQEQIKQQEVKKYRWRIAELEGKMESKVPTSDIMEEYKSQIDQMNRKIMNMTRIMNQKQIDLEHTEEQLLGMRKKLQDHIKKTNEKQDEITNLKKVKQQLQKNIKNQVFQYESLNIKSIKLSEQLVLANDNIKKLTQDLNKQLLDRKLKENQLSFKSEEAIKKQAETQRLLKEIERLKRQYEIFEQEKYSNKNQYRNQLEDYQRQLKQAAITNKKLIQEVEKLEIQLNYAKKAKQQSEEHISSEYRYRLQNYTNELEQLQQILAKNQKGNQILQSQMKQLTIQNEQIKNENLQAKKIIEQLTSQINKLTSENNKIKQENKILHVKTDEDQFQLKKVQKHIESLTNKLQQAEGNVLRYQQQAKQYEFLCENRDRQINFLKQQLEKFHDYEYFKTQCKNLKNEVESHKNQSFSINKQFQRYKQQYKFTKQEVDDFAEEIRKTYLIAANEKLSCREKSLQEKHQEVCKKLQQQLNNALQYSNRLKFQQAKLKNQLIALKRDQQDYERMKQQLSLMKKQKEKEKKEYEQLEKKLQKNVEKLHVQQEESRNIQIKLKREIKQLQQTYNTISQHYDKQAHKNHILSMKIEELQHENQQNQKANSKLFEQFHKGKTLLSQNIQNLQSENKKYKIQLENIQEDCKNQLRKMEFKTSEAITKMQERQNALTRNYNHENQDIRIQLSKAHQQVANLRADLNEITKVLEKSKLEGQELQKQYYQYRLQTQQQFAKWQVEVQKTHKKLKDTQDFYRLTIQQLQQQLGLVSKQLTQAKYAKSQKDFGKSSTDHYQQKYRKYEDKVRIKEKKIQELKQHVLQMEQNITKMKQKQLSQEKHILGISKYQSQLKYLGQTIQQREKIIDENAKIIKQLKVQIYHYKKQQQNMSVLLEQKNLEIQSITCQLKTIRDLYSDIQRQLTKKMAVHSSPRKQNQLCRVNQKQKQQVIQELEHKIAQMNKALQNAKRENTKKHLRILCLEEQIKKVDDIEKRKGLLHNIQLNQYETEFQNKVRNAQMHDKQHKINELKQQNNILKQQIMKLKNNNTNLVGNEQNLTSQIVKLQKEVSNIKNKFKQCERQAEQYRYIEEYCYQELGISVKQAVQGAFFKQELTEKQQEINQCYLHIQQLQRQLEKQRSKQNSQRNQIYQVQMQLQLKEDQLQLQMQKMSILRQLSQSLQKDKNSAIFKQNRLRMQLQNLVQFEHGQLKARLRNILENNCSDIY